MLNYTQIELIWRGVPEDEQEEFLGLMIAGAIDFGRRSFEKAMSNLPHNTNRALELNAIGDEYVRLAENLIELFEENYGQLNGFN